MNIWNCKGPLAALALTFLAGCGGGLKGAFLEGLESLEGLTKSESGSTVALSQARMAFGEVTLVPPPGYCIDERSLKQQFALMARCDALGVPSAAAGAPLGIITASFAPWVEGAPLPTPAETADALKLQTINDPIVDGESVTFRATTTKPRAGAAAAQWRGTARVGGQIMGLALHAPEDGRALSSEGRALLAAVIRASGPDLRVQTVSE